jgi:Flp pilus assembly pilin Flp
MRNFFHALIKDEAGTAVTEWVVVASIMALAGIATFLAIGEDVEAILDTISDDVDGVVAGGGFVAD